MNEPIHSPQFDPLDDRPERAGSPLRGNPCAHLTTDELDDFAKSEQPQQSEPIAPEKGEAA